MAGSDSLSLFIDARCTFSRIIQGHDEPIEMLVFKLDDNGILIAADVPELSAATRVEGAR